MNMNKHTLWHTIRTVSAGLFIIGLIPLPFIFMGAGNTSSINTYFLYLSISFIGVIVGQLMVTRYKQYANTSNLKKKQEKIYGIIGISLILLFFLPFIVVGILSQFSR